MCVALGPSTGSDVVFDEIWIQVVSWTPWKRSIDTRLNGDASLLSTCVRITKTPFITKSTHPLRDTNLDSIQFNFVRYVSCTVHSISHFTLILSPGKASIDDDDIFTAWGKCSHWRCYIRITVLTRVICPQSLTQWPFTFSLPYGPINLYADCPPPLPPPPSG